MSLVLCTTKTTTTPAANGPVGPNDNNNNTDNTSEDSNPLTIYRYIRKNSKGEGNESPGKVMEQKLFCKFYSSDFKKKYKIKISQKMFLMLRSFLIFLLQVSGSNSIARLYGRVQWYGRPSRSRYPRFCLYTRNFFYINVVTKNYILTCNSLEKRNNGDN